MAQKIGADKTTEPLEQLLKKVRRPKLHLPLPKDE